MIKYYQIFRVSPKDTKLIRQTLKDNGFKVKQCKLGGNRQYILIHTDDNKKALPVISEMGYTINSIWLESPENIFQNNSMMFRKEKEII